MFCTSFSYWISTFQPILCIDFCNGIMKFGRSFLILKLGIILTNHHLLPRKFVLFGDRKNCTMYMWICFVQMYHKCSNVFLSKSITHKPIHILSPVFYFWHSSDGRIVCTTFQIHLLISKSQTVHLVSRSS